MSSSENRPLAAKTAVIASLGVAALVGLIAVTAPRSDVAPARDATVSATSATPAGIAGNRHPLRHSHKGQWHAEARTFVGIVRYLFEPEFQAKPGEGATPLPAAVPTNIVSTSLPMHSTS
jgi:hypothetical protein